MPELPVAHRLAKTVPLLPFDRQKLLAEVRAHSVYQCYVTRQRVQPQVVPDALLLHASRL